MSDNDSDHPNLDLRRRVECYEVFSDWSQIERQFPKVNQNACLDKMHVVTAEARIAAGFDASEFNMGATTRVVGPAVPLHAWRAFHRTPCLCENRVPASPGRLSTSITTG
jgi:hypothetical protein